MKGSSAMPHKRNPKVAERICGLARVVRAAAVGRARERRRSGTSATSRSRRPSASSIPDAFLALDYMLDRFIWIVDGLVVYPERMLRNLDASHGLVFSHRLLLALVESGLDARRGLPPRPAARDAGLGRGERLPRRSSTPTPRSPPASIRPRSTASSTSQRPSSTSTPSSTACTPSSRKEEPVHV